MYRTYSSTLQGSKRKRTRILPRSMLHRKFAGWSVGSVERVPLFLPVRLAWPEPVALWAWKTGCLAHGMKDETRGVMLAVWPSVPSPIIERAKCLIIILSYTDMYICVLYALMKRIREHQRHAAVSRSHHTCSVLVSR